MYRNAAVSNPERYLLDGDGVFSWDWNDFFDQIADTDQRCTQDKERQPI